jgi:cytochrome b subunit of formate dehydrogenase
MKKIVNDFYAKYPARIITISSNYNSIIKKEDISWYLNIHDFLDQCKRRKETQDNYNKEQL